MKEPKPPQRYWPARAFWLSAAHGVALSVTLLATAGLVAAAPEAQHATAAPTPVVPGTWTLVWEGPAECGTATWFRARVNAAIAGRGINSNQLAVNVRLSAEANTTNYMLSLQLTTENSSGERALQAGSCTELADAAATIVALSLSPEPEAIKEPPRGSAKWAAAGSPLGATSKSPELRSDAQPQPPLPELKAPPIDPRPDAVTAVQPTTSTAQEPPTPPLEKAPPEAAAPKEPALAPEKQDKLHQLQRDASGTSLRQQDAHQGQWGVLGGLQWLSGVLPNAAPEFELGVSHWLGDLEVAVRLGLSLPIDSDGAEQGPLQVSRLSGRAQLSKWWLPHHTLALGLETELSAGLLSGDATPVISPASGWSMGVGGGLALYWKVLDDWHLRPNISGRFAAVQSKFSSVERALTQTLWEESRFGSRVGLAIVHVF